MLSSETKRHIDAARQVLVGVVPNPTSQIDQITNALIYKFMDDMDQAAIKQGDEPSFFTGDLERYAWTRLVDTRIGNQERMNIYSEVLLKFSESKQLPELFRNIFKSAFLPYRSPEVLGLFLKEINYFDYSHPEELGNAYEYLLSIMSSQGDAGQFRTPRHIIDFIVDVVNPTKDDKVLDPACGTGGFLVSSYKHILEQHDGLNDPEKKEKPLTPDERRNLMNNFEGYDIDPSMVRIAQVNMYLHQFKNPKIVQYDTLSMEDRWSDKFDVILANPPFMSPKGGVQTHTKFSIQSTRSEVLFVDYIMSHLRPKGRAGIIVPEGIIFQSGTAHKQLRKNLVDDGLYAVVSLPKGIFQPYSGVKTSILLFDNELAKKNTEILFIKIENDGFDLGVQRKMSSKNDLPQTVKIINAWKRGKKTESTSATYVEKTKIAEGGDYNFSGDRYKIATDHISTKWPMVKLEDVCEINPKKSEISKLLPDTKISFVPMVDISENEMLFIPKQEKELLDVSSSYTYFKDNDVLLAKVTPCFENGKAGIAKNLRNGIGFGSSELIVLRASEKILPELIYYFITSQDFRRLGKNQMTGTGGLQRIPTDFVKKYPIPLLPLEIQTQIISELRDLEEEIKFNKRETASLKKLQNKIICNALEGFNSDPEDIPWMDKNEINSELKNISELLLYMQNNQGNSAFIYLFESAVLSLREVSFLFEKYFPEKLDQSIKNKISLIVKARNAICHRSSSLNFLSIENKIKVVRNIAVGKGTLIKIGETEIKSEFEDDIAIFYGEIRIYVVRDMRHLLNKFNEIFASDDGKI